VLAALDASSAIDKHLQKVNKVVVTYLSALL